MRAIEFGEMDDLRAAHPDAGERAALHGAGRHDDPQHPHRRQPRGPARGLQPGRSIQARMLLGRSVRPPALLEEEPS